MKKYSIYYNFENPTYEQIKKKQKELKAKISYDYNDLIEKYNLLLYSFNANDFQNLILESKKILLRYLEEIFKIFPQLQIIPISIFLNGSYAKEFNRPHSDIDINFVYPDKYKNDIFPIEEIINYIIKRFFPTKILESLFSKHSNAHFFSSSE